MEAALVLWLFVLSPAIALPILQGQTKLPFYTPQFMVNLYKCVNQSSPLKCYGVNANSVRSLLGSYDTTTANESSVRFNMSTLISQTQMSRNDTLLSAEIRVYRRGLSQSERDLLDASRCSSTTVQLYATMVSGKDSIVVSSASLQSCDMGTEQWVGFKNVTSIYYAWARNDLSKYQTITMVANGPCGLQQLGFTEMDEYDPLLVAYFSSSLGRLNIIGGSTALSLGAIKRGASQCTLQPFQIDLGALGLTNYYPSTYVGNLCSGQCTVPTGQSDPLYTTEHAAFQYFLSAQNNAVLQPCCVPLNYGVQSFLVYGAGTVTLTSLSKAIATSCHCA